MDASRYISIPLIGLSFLLALVAPAEAGSGWKTDSVTCGEWWPSADEVEWGQVLRQSRTCRTDMIRHRNGEQQTRFNERVSWRTVRGQRDRFLDIERSSQWSPWQIDWSTLRDCKGSALLDEQIDHNQGYTNLEQCSARETRYKAVVERWLSGKEVRLKAQEQQQSRDTSLYLAATKVGRHDRWLPARPTYLAWKNKKKHVQCEPWPSALVAQSASALWGELTLLPRRCYDQQTRTVKQIRRSLSGRKEVVSTTTEARLVPNLQWRSAHGTEDEVIGQHWEQASDWTKQAANDCQARPLSPWVPHGVAHHQISECSGQEVQTFHLVSKYRSGAVLVHDMRENTRNATWLVTVTGVGQLDELLEAEAERRSSEWLDDGGERCAAWTPDVYAVDKGKSFSQTRLCEQAQRQYTETLSRWTSGDKWSTVSQDRRIIERSDVREAVGKKQITLALPTWTISVTDGLSQMGGVHTVSDARDFDRIRISVGHTSNKARPKISVVTPNGQTLELPPVDRGAQNYYFNVEDYGLVTQGDWHVLVSVPSGSDDHTVTVAVSLEKR